MIATKTLSVLDIFPEKKKKKNEVAPAVVLLSLVARNRNQISAEYRYWRRNQFLQSTDKRKCDTYRTLSYDEEGLSAVELFEPPGTYHAWVWIDPRVIGEFWLRTMVRIKFNPQHVRRPLLG